MKFNVEDIQISSWARGKQKIWGLNQVIGVQIKHLPSGMVVRMDEHESSHKNRQAAFQELETRLKEFE